ncbi:MAG: 4'-phosphopantetheinyl transferase superfamily protein [Ruminococcus sp.]|nr:4'-phosphopantetheinyl transferase superfamily protein [Ruminococcus sp.]
MLMISLFETEKGAQHRHAHSLLRQCLRPIGIDYREELLARGEHGKPYLPDLPEVHFSLSHAKGIAACLVEDRECGIDCEGPRPLRPGVVKRAFSEAEQELVGSAEDRDLMFLRLWTLKEAYVKAIGTGLAFPLKEAEFSISPQGEISGPEGFSYRQYLLRGGFVVSLAVSQEPGGKFKKYSKNR